MNHGTDDRSHWLFALTAAVLIAMAALAGWRTTRDLTWGPYVDFDRDASFVNGILEGHYGEDPLYQGHSLWFTPLLFGIEAALVKVTGLPVPVLQVRAGALLNLLVPIAFLLMVRRYFGPWVALPALAFLLFFIPGQEPGWAVSTYSPWLLPVNFFQALFYLLLIQVHRAMRTLLFRDWGIAGAGAGILFLGHAAPTLVIVGLIAVLVLSGAATCLRQDQRPEAVRWILRGTLAGAAFIVFSLPLTWYVVGVYGLDQQNRVPSSFTYHILAWRNAGFFLFHNITWITAFGVAGLVLLVFGPVSLSRRIVLLVTGIAFFLMCYVYASVLLNEYCGVALPMAVPSFHFYLYLKGALAIGAGIAFQRLMQGLQHFAPTVGFTAQGRNLVTALSTLVAAAVIYPAYAHRCDLDVVRLRCQLRMEDAAATDMVAAIRQRLSWGGVVLCDEDLSMRIVMATARKTVATNASMANPYVPPAPREAARDTLLAALRDASIDPAFFLETYNVSHLLVRRSDLNALPELRKWFPLTVHTNDRYVLFGR